jgi:hypothetical protein
VQQAKTYATSVGRTASGPQQADAAFVAERLDRLHDICALGQTLLDMLLGQLKLDVGSFRDVLRVTPGHVAVDDQKTTGKPPRPTD